MADRSWMTHAGGSGSPRGDPPQRGSTPRGAERCGHQRGRRTGDDGDPVADDQLTQRDPDLPRVAASVEGFPILLLGIFHNWLLIPAPNLNRNVVPTLIKWTVIMAVL
jgi:hypothetical protein